MRADPLVWLPGIVAAVVSAACWGGWVTTQSPELLLLAIVVQVGAGVAVSWLTCRERRALAIAIAVTVPIFGILAVAWIDGTRGEGGAELLADPEARKVRIDGAKVARLLTNSLPPCEAIASGNTDYRRATITHLSKRAGADDIAILNWAREQPDQDLAVDAALALEDVGQRMEALLAITRDGAIANPTFETHAAVVRAICDGIVSGLVDSAMIGRLAVNARAHYDAAIAFDPGSASLIAAARARIELAARCPEAALAVLKTVIGKTADEEIVQLYTDAAYAARCFDLVPGYRAAASAAASATMNAATPPAPPSPVESAPVVARLRLVDADA